jgi:hypothetical protein
MLALLLQLSLLVLWPSSLLLMPVPGKAAAFSLS